MHWLRHAVAAKARRLLRVLLLRLSAVSAHPGGGDTDLPLTRPAQRGAAVFTRRREGGAVDRHLFLSQAAQYRAWQYALDQNVLLKNHFLAALAAEALENSA